MSNFDQIFTEVITWQAEHPASRILPSEAEHVTDEIYEAWGIAAIQGRRAGLDIRRFTRNALEFKDEEGDMAPLITHAGRLVAPLFR
jgi:hypothetical protein